MAVCAIGRRTRQYVTAYSLDRVQPIRVRRMAKRCLVADFNGALPTGRTISSVVWRCTSPWATVLSNAAVDAGLRIVSVDCHFANAGCGGVKATVTLDNGDLYTANFEATVTDTSWYDEAAVAAGPYSVSA